LKILVGQDWSGGYLDEHRPPGSLRIRVLGMATCLALRDVYYVRDRSVQRVWSHLREVGPVWLGRKIASRLSETGRNEKFASIGLGVVVEADPEAAHRVGRTVAFLAPCHPRALERIVLPGLLVADWSGARPDGLSDDWLAQGRAPELAAGIREIAGWSPYSGTPLEPERISALLDDVRKSIDGIQWDHAERFTIGESEPLCERAGPRSSSEKPTAALFGYGHYARTIVKSGVHGLLDLRAVHEIDPALMPPSRSREIRWDTSPIPNADERYDAYLIASYHHTHAPLAVHALAQDAAAVVEKPLATDRAQLDALLSALATGRGRFFAGYHKRYSPLNDLALMDCPTPEPIHYHCIVFEEPLPARHWYRWPNSRSRIISNGCHWLDHFLFLNDWSEPKELQVARSGLGHEIVNVSVRLENGAFFSMLLSEAGSSRIGVRDYIELRCGKTTVTIENGSRYAAENGKRVVRRAHVNKMASYERMYREIASAIAGGGAGDSPRSVEASSRFVLDAEAAYAHGH
jgi:predicted dehydrogenase